MLLALQHCWAAPATAPAAHLLLPLLLPHAGDSQGPYLGDLGPMGDAGGDRRWVPEPVAGGGVVVVVTRVSSSKPQ